MRGKYTNPLLFHAVRGQRAVLRAVLSRMVRWEPIAQPVEGYTLVIGCPTALWPILPGNLERVAAQDLTHLAEIVIVCDRPREAMPADLEGRARAAFPALPLRFFYLPASRRRLARAIGSPWVFSWLQWATGIAHVRTRHAMLHDFDALLIRPDFVEERYRTLRERGVQYLGTQLYRFGHLTADDGLVSTIELFFDAAFVRRTFRPIDLFNHVTLFRGRTIDFDTFLHAQTLAGEASVLMPPDEDFLHPAQVVTQFQKLMHRPGYRPPDRNNLLWIPYFFFLGGEPSLIEDLALQLERKAGGHVRFFGRGLDLRPLSATHLREMAEPIRYAERSIAGAVRAPVERYLAALEASVARWQGAAATLAAAPT